MKDADVFFRERYAVWQETSAFIYSNINTSDVVGNLCVPLPKPGLGLRSGLFEQAAQCGPICPNVDMASSIIWEYPEAISYIEGTITLFMYLSSLWFLSLVTFLF